MAVTLIPEVQVCCLCGASPTLEQIELSAAKCFKSSHEILYCAVQTHPVNFPLEVKLDEGILG